MKCKLKAPTLNAKCLSGLDGFPKEIFVRANVGVYTQTKIEIKNLIKKEKTLGFQPQIFSIKACLNEGSDIFASFVFSFGYTEMNQPLLLFD